MLVSEKEEELSLSLQKKKETIALHNNNHTNITTKKHIIFICFADFRCTKVCTNRL